MWRFPVKPVGLGVSVLFPVCIFVSQMNKGLLLIYEVGSKIKEEIRSGLMNLIYIIHLIFFVSYYKIG